jgi:hypothetical protein
MKITEVQMTHTSGLGYPRGTIEVGNHTLSICVDGELMGGPMYGGDPILLMNELDPTQNKLYEIGVLDDKGLIYLHHTEEETPEGHKKKNEELISLLKDYGMGYDGVMRGLSKKRMLEAVNILVTWAISK